MPYIPPFDHPLVIAGQGTIGMELLRQSSTIGKHKTLDPRPWTMGMDTPWLYHQRLDPRPETWKRCSLTLNHEP